MRAQASTTARDRGAGDVDQRQRHRVDAQAAQRARPSGGLRGRPRDEDLHACPPGIGQYRLRPGGQISVGALVAQAAPPRCGPAPGRRVVADRAGLRRAQQRRQRVRRVAQRRRAAQAWRRASARARPAACCSCRPARATPRARPAPPARSGGASAWPGARPARPRRRAPRCRARPARRRAASGRSRRQRGCGRPGQPLQPRGGQHDGVVLAFVELAQPRVEVAAQRLARQVGPQRDQAAPRGAGSRCRPPRPAAARPGVA